MKLVLIIRGLAKGRRQKLIDEIKEPYELEDYTQIDTPAPKEKITKEELKRLNSLAYENFKSAVNMDKELIIVNNTNTKRYHYYYYLTYAQDHDYLTAVVIVPWNDMSDRELVIDGGNTKPASIYKTYRRDFQWEI